MSGANRKHFCSFCSISLFSLSGNIAVVLDITKYFLFYFILACVKSCYQELPPVSSSLCLLPGVYQMCSPSI